MSERNEMTDSVEIRFIDENGEMIFLEREFIVGNKLYTMRTSEKTNVRYRLKLKIT